MTLEAVLRKDGTNVMIKGKFCRPSENSRYKRQSARDNRFRNS